MGTHATSGVRVWSSIQVHQLIPNSPAIRSQVVLTDDLFGPASAMFVSPKHGLVKVVLRTERAWRYCKRSTSVRSQGAELGGVTLSAREMGTAFWEMRWWERKFAQHLQYIVDYYTALKQKNYLILSKNEFINENSYRFMFKPSNFEWKLFNLI